ncbi:MAG TPA: CDP-alcohol phosphatidyltransferase family protein [Bryobacteraceae bacterium]|nr:CDP-alcohol phosphatidyltransferase family protein [Bryobacteraceae bacterium]
MRIRCAPRMKYVPNLLTAARILATPYLFWLTWQQAYTPVIVLFIAMGLTDAADGFLARLFHASSRLGAYLDPIADKLLLSGMFVTLFAARLIEPWLALVVLGRDLLILLAAAGFYVARARRDFPPSACGKLSTLAQILFVCFRLGDLDGIRVHFAVIGLQWAVVALVIVSTADYARRVLPLNPKSDAHHHN